MARCLLASVDQKKPFVSTELEELRDKTAKTGLVRKSKLESDLRNIESAAYQTVLVDEFGHQHYSPDRAQILSRLREFDVAHENFRKMIAIAQNVAGSARVERALDANH
jgi:hypothetical protein